MKRTAAIARQPTPMHDAQQKPAFHGELKRNADKTAASLVRFLPTKQSNMRLAFTAKCFFLGLSFMLLLG